MKAGGKRRGGERAKNLVEGFKQDKRERERERERESGGEAEAEGKS